MAKKQASEPASVQARFFRREILSRDQKLARVDVSNRVLKSFAPSTWLSLADKSRGDRVVVSWKWKVFASGDWKTTAREWVSMSVSDFYPTWGDQWAHGNTAMTALSQLVRWVRGLPVLPVNPTWRYWASGQGGLLRRNQDGVLWGHASGKSGRSIDELDRNDWALSLLLSAGYPEVASCILCGEPIVDNKDGRYRGIDWWSKSRLLMAEPGRVSGPCCMWGMCLNNDSP